MTTFIATFAYTAPRVNDLTRILTSAGADKAAAEQLLPLVYRELRALAAHHLAREQPGQTLNATALVHEAYLRLLGPEGAGRAGQWDGRGHFFAAAAEAMRRILIENARRKSRLKRGGGRQRVDLDGLELTINDPPEELIALDEALTELAGKHPKKAKLVELRFFAGLSNQEAARELDISTSTANRDWAFARAWLYRRLAQEGGAAGPSRSPE
jgi:RNA polymerase sigma factor (TIGR02999 family)